MKKTLIATMAATLIASVAVPAMAAQYGKGKQRGPDIERMIERFDLNQDGSVTPAEVSEQRKAMFDSVDTDGSGSLNAEELKTFGDMRKAQRAQMKEDRRAERAQAEDGKKDGKMAMKDGERKGKWGKHDGKRADRGDRGGPSLKRMDADNNGEISREEFAAKDAKMFKRFDRNGDGKIDITDFYRKGKSKG